MIQRLCHTTIFVLDQEASKDFYVNKLGFDVNTDVTMDNGYRWLTISPKGQKDMEIILMAVGPGSGYDDETSGHLQWLLNHGKLGAGVWSTADCRKTYEELKAKGVEFTKEPTEEFYAIEAVFKDNSGNWFSLSQHKDH
jgi:catechol 2,3-dioxygenase-like lactoylglutathione lyase family enzyme